LRPGDAKAIVAFRNGPAARLLPHTLERREAMKFVCMNNGEHKKDAQKKDKKGTKEGKN